MVTSGWGNRDQVLRLEFHNKASLDKREDILKLLHKVLSISNLNLSNMVVNKPNNLMVKRLCISRQEPERMVSSSLQTELDKSLCPQWESAENNTESHQQRSITSSMCMKVPTVKWSCMMAVCNRAKCNLANLWFKASLSLLVAAVNKKLPEPL